MNAEGVCILLRSQRFGTHALTVDFCLTWASHCNLKWTYSILLWRVDNLNHLWNTLKFCKARNYTQLKVWLMFVWVSDRVTKDSFRETNRHKIRLILQNAKIFCYVCGGYERTKRYAGIFPSAPWQPASPHFCCLEGKLLTARPSLSALGVPPCFLMICEKERKPESKRKKASHPQAEDILGTLT